MYVSLRKTLFEAVVFERLNDAFECVLGFHSFIPVMIERGLTLFVTGCLGFTSMTIAFEPFFEQDCNWMDLRVLVKHLPNATTLAIEPLGSFKHLKSSLTAIAVKSLGSSVLEVH